MTGIRIQKWSHSIASCIPATILRTSGIPEGQSVALSVEDGALVTRPAQKRYTLAALMAQCDLSQPVSAAGRE